MRKYSLPGLLLFCALTSMAQDSRIERGKYLATEIGKCQDCHTPMSAAGEPDTSKWMKGADLGIQPVKEIKGWHTKAPDITGASRLFERWGDDGMIKFLSTGKNPRGGKADPPMPTYTMKQEDAEAVVAYLKSLK